MTEDQIRSAVRAEITPLREDVTSLREDFAEFKGEVIEKLDILGQRMEVASDDRREMLRILRLLEWRRSGGRSHTPTEMAAKGSN